MCACVNLCVYAFIHTKSKEKGSFNLSQNVLYDESFDGLSTEGKGRGDKSRCCEYLCVRACVCGHLWVRVCVCVGVWVFAHSVRLCTDSNDCARACALEAFGLRCSCFGIYLATILHCP